MIVKHSEILLYMIYIYVYIYIYLHSIDVNTACIFMDATCKSCQSSCSEYKVKMDLLITCIYIFVYT